MYTHKHTAHGVTRIDTLVQRFNSLRTVWGYTDTPLSGPPTLSDIHQIFTPSRRGLALVGVLTMSASRPGKDDGHDPNSSRRTAEIPFEPSSVAALPIVDHQERDLVPIADLASSPEAVDELHTADA